ncbi:MAG TPA: XrtA system polysaccharide deacetylase [Gemmatimonadaceae bacterium]|jgi:polysaccharide deacetylase family protein (PEP-CTERM system associated)|nr:XrtA system polysaccharide deacetylase [Gemmatimonadaceae bacterium]
MPTSPFAAYPTATTPRRVRHIFSVDVEEYFQVNAFERSVCRDRWTDYPSRVEESTDALLSLLAEHEATATFFCLGWVAERHKRLIRRIAEAGHEVASHGWWHRRVTELSRAEFEWEVRSSKQLLEDITGCEVVGYRAPSFSIVRGLEWALDILVEQGYRYDSSLFPIRRSGYGYAHGLAIPHTWVQAAGSLVELPPATLNTCGLRVPAAGGGYLRQLPLELIRAAVRQHASNGFPAMLYIHPWELDPGQPRLPVGAVTRLRHYRGIGRTVDRLRKLLGEFQFTAAVQYMKEMRPTTPMYRAAESPELPARDPRVIATP